MNNRSVFRALAIAALVIAAAGAVGIAAYNAGMAQGMAETGRAIVAAPPGAQPVYVWPRPWGFGFFQIFPFVFLVFLFFILRGLLWRGRWRNGCGYRSGGVPPDFDEWHRRAHGEQVTSTPALDRTT